MIQYELRGANDAHTYDSNDARYEVTLQPTAFDLTEPQTLPVMVTTMCVTGGRVTPEACQVRPGIAKISADSTLLSPPTILAAVYPLRASL